MLWYGGREMNEFPCRPKNLCCVQSVLEVCGECGECGKSV